jgi:uncharacterized protein (TIGR02453 family)
MSIVPVSQSRFAGFPRHAFELLRQLGVHNDRRWFATNRRELESALVAPALALVVDLGVVLRRAVSTDIRSEPRVGGSLLRMQHDARHVRAAPFRTHLELWFWEGAGPSRDHPGCFIQLAPDRMVIGAGITVFPPQYVVPYREAVDRPRTGRELLAILRRLGGEGWTIRASRRRRVPDPYPADHERGDLLRLTGLRVERPGPLPDAVFHPALPRALAPEYARLRPFHRWLADVS